MLGLALAVTLAASSAARSPTPTDIAFKTAFPAKGGLQPRGSTVAVDPLGRGNWVIDSDADRVLLMKPGEEAKEIAVGRWPEQLVVDPLGRVYVTCRQDNRVDRIDLDLHVTSVSTGAEPSGLYLDAPTGRLWVGLVTERALALIDTGTLTVVRQRPVDFEPGPVELMPEGLAVLARQGGTLLFSSPSLDPADDWVVQLRPRRGEKAWRGEAMARVGEDLFVVHSDVDPGLSRPAASGTYGGGGGFQTPVSTSVTLLHHGVAYQTLSTPELSGVTAIAVRDDQLAFVARSHGMVVRAKLVERRALVDVVSLFAGEGLSGVTFDEQGRAVALASFDRELEWLDKELPDSASHLTWAEGDLSREATRLRPGEVTRVAFGMASTSVRPQPYYPSGERLAVVDHDALPDVKLDAEVALGRRLFFDDTDSRISTAGLACASCHPDGRQDGVVWRLNGSRRQTMLLAGRLADTAPYNWKGTTKTLEDNIAQTTERLGGTGLSKPERHALARYLVAGLRRVTLPPQDAALVARGDQLFHDDAVGCATCHPSDGAFTDGETHDVGSVRRGEQAELLAQAARAETARSFERSALGTHGRSIPPKPVHGASLGGRTVGVPGPKGLQPVGSGPLQTRSAQLVAMMSGGIGLSSLGRTSLSLQQPIVLDDPKDHAFDTPSLRGLAVSAPYMHDGAYPTLESLLEENHDRMGTTGALSAGDRAALAAYLRTL